MATALVLDPLFYQHETGLHPESPARLASIEAAFGRRGTREGTVSLPPRPATRAELELVHTASHIDWVETACRQGQLALDPDTVICPASYEVACRAVGAVLSGVDALIAGEVSNVFVAGRPPGHHATPSESMGFCLFNQIAVAARYAQVRYGLERVLILDWDVHHGNGTQAAFYPDPSVFYVSWHQAGLYPGTGWPSEQGEGKGQGFTRNVPMRAFTPAATYREVFMSTLREVTTGFSPDLVLISAGFDSHAQDPLGSFMLEDSDFRDMTVAALDIAHRTAGGRLLSVLEGGYNVGLLGDTVAVHVEALKRA